MIAKVISSILILVTLYMGIKQGWPIIGSKAEMLGTLSKWGIGETIAPVLGLLTLGAAILVLFPQTFFYGNVITALVIIYVMGSQLIHSDMQSAVFELPFLIMPLVLLYLGHPFSE